MIEIRTSATPLGVVIQEARGPAAEVGEWFNNATRSNPGSMGEFMRLMGGEAKAFIKVSETANALG